MKLNSSLQGLLYLGVGVLAVAAMWLAWYLITGQPLETSTPPLAFSAISAWIVGVAIALYKEAV